MLMQKTIWEYQVHSKLMLFMLRTWQKKMAGGNELTFVGHSLGGELAALASMFTGCAAIMFNPASVNGALKILVTQCMEMER